MFDACWICMLKFYACWKCMLKFMWVGYAICMLKLKFWEDLVSFSRFRPFPGSNMQKTCKKHAFWWAFLQIPKVLKNLGKMHVFCMFGPKTSKKNNKHAKNMHFPRFLIDFGVPPLEFKNACVLACALARACCLDWALVTRNPRHVFPRKL